MRRSLVEFGATVAASVLIALGAVIAGGNMVAAPASIPDRLRQQAGCLDASVVELNGSGVNGRAKLCIVDEGVRPMVDVEGLTPATAYATWFAYFDRPQECRRWRCTIEDLGGETSVGVAGRMDAIVADGIRKAQFNGDFRDLRLTSGSEVSVLVFERGPVSTGDTRGRARQLLTLELRGFEVPTTRRGVGIDRLVAQATFDLP